MTDDMQLFFRNRQQISSTLLSRFRYPRQARWSALAVPVFLLGFMWYPNAEANFSLEKVVLIERHGIRAPTKAPATYAKYAAEAWPDWPVAPGELTAHGAE